MPALILLYALVTLALVFVARLVARAKGRNWAAWMWATALVPPVLLVLVVLPRLDKETA